LKGAINMPIEFSTREYEWTHGHKPRGRGYWWFFFEGHEFSAWGTYTEAKRACVKKIREMAPKGYTEHVVVTVGT
jgi:hypothetical protein